jgi:hypothetical protein
MKTSRLLYFFIALFVIFLGILSRKIAGVPLFFGDVLYAVLIYFCLRTVFLQQSKTGALFSSIAICFTIEFLQLLQYEWLVQIRNTVLGHYILGTGFLISDLFYYCIGGFLGFFGDLLKKSKNNFFF